MQELFINSVKVDTYDDIPMPVTYAIADILTPEKRNTAFSKTIKLPGSKNNDLLFTNIFEVSKEIQNSQNIVNFTPEFNPALKADAKIFNSSVRTFSGICQLKEIIYNVETHEYEVNLTGHLKDLFLSIEGRLLEELDMSEYNHAYTYPNMKNSWDTSIRKNGSAYVNFSAGVPTGEGYVYNTMDIGIKAASIGGAGGLPNSISIDKTFPSIYVREYWTKIFALAGFSWDSDFLDSELFRRLIIPYCYRKDFVNAAELTKRKFKATRTTSQSSAANFGTSVFEMPIVHNNDSTGGNFDNYPAFNFAHQPFALVPSITYSGWLVPKTGSYDLTATWSATATLGNINDRALLIITPRIKILRASGYTDSTLVEGAENISPTAGNSYSTSGTVSGTNIQLYKGDFVYVAIAYRRLNSLPSIPFGSSNSSITLTLSSGSTFYNNPITTLTTIGDTFQLNTAIPKGIQIKDFVLSIIRMFNLYVEPSSDDDNVLKIEPFIDFFNATSVGDWIEDTDKERSDKPCASVDAKSFDYKYKKDSDYYNTLYLDTHKTEYGQKKFDAINDFAKGTKTVELIFSPTPSVAFGTPGSDMVIPRIVKENSVGDFEAFDSNIRILYYGGVRSTNQFWVWGDVLAGFSTESTYAYAGHLDDPFNPTLDLLFNMPKQIYYGSPTNVTYTTNNLFNKYWLQFIKEIVDPDSRLVTTWIHLRADQIFKLNFRAPIYLNGINYRLNKIIEYDNDRESTQVELIKVKSGFVFVPNFEVVITQEDPTNFDLIEGGLNEVVSLSRVTNIDIIDGSKDTVINLGGASNINVINGGIG